jgi:hypothetical protein
LQPRSDWSCASHQCRHTRKGAPHTVAHKEGRRVMPNERPDAPGAPPR